MQGAKHYLLYCYSTTWKRNTSCLPSISMRMIYTPAAGVL